MPFTFLAHQAPLLPPLRRRPRYVDGLAVVVGSMAPDFAYAIDDIGPWRFRSHDLPGLVVFCVPVTLVVSWVIARVLAPVVPDRLPRTGPFSFGDYRELRNHRFGLVRSPVSAFVGALSHSALDQFTHSWGWVAHHWRWYRTPVVDARWLGKVWAPFEFAQFTGHVVLSAWCLWLLARFGRARWFAPGPGAPPVGPVGPGTRLALWLPAVSATVASLVYVLARPQDESTDVMRVFGGAFAGLVAGSVLVLAMDRIRVDG